MTRWEQEQYNLPMYGVRDAARYLGIPVPTLNSWLQGRRSPTRNGQKTFEPLIQRPSPDQPYLSFTNLIEAHVLGVIRRGYRVKLDKVRVALDYMSQRFGTAHPLILQRFQTDGVDLFVEEVDQLVNVARGGQLAMRETLEALLTRIEWNAEGIASRFFPITEVIADPNADKIIFLDPAIRFGRPIIAGKGVPTDIIVELYNAGDSIEKIADEYDCTPLQIRRAIQFESQSCAA